MTETYYNPTDGVLYSAVSSATKGNVETITAKECSIRTKMVHHLLEQAREALIGIDIDGMVQCGEWEKDNPWPRQ